MAEAVVGERAALARSVLNLPGVDIEVFQGGEGPVLLFLHGGGGLQADAPFLRLLSKRFRVVAPSHPGFGGSSLPFWMDSVDDFAHVHFDVIDQLKLDHITLVGASIGGWTAAEMATKNTSHIDRLVLVSPVGIKVGPVDKLDIPDIFAMAQEKVERLIYHQPEKWRLDPAKKTDEELLTIARNRETLTLVTWEPFMHNPKLNHRLHRIDRPTLILRGASDGLVSQHYAEAYAKLIPGARLDTIPEAGHVPFLEQPEAFVDRIVRFAGR
jgi:pimeloyl-ACP methyl ester carboxylesterase